MNDENFLTPYLTMPSTLQLVKQLVPDPPKKSKWKQIFVTYGFITISVAILATFLLLAWIFRHAQFKPYLVQGVYIATLLVSLSSVIMLVRLLWGDMLGLLRFPERNSSDQLDNEMEQEQVLLFLLKELPLHEIKNRRKRLNFHIHQLNTLLLASTPVILLSAFVPILQSPLVKTTDGRLTQTGIYLIAFYAGMTIGALLLLRTVKILGRLAYVMKRAERDSKRLSKLSR